MMNIKSSSPSNPHVGLFITCLVNAVRPSVGFAAVKLLKDAGCGVSVPFTQTCCGQPAWNSGDAFNTKKLAIQVIQDCEEFDYVVLPSGSCAGMLRHHYPKLLVNNTKWAARARALAEKTWELTSFLTDVMGVAATDIQAQCEVTATYHDSCAGLRELGIKEQPRQLLKGVSGLILTEMEDTEVCCGFGGTFCVKYSDISNRMVTDKMDRAMETGADVLLGGDLGCLLNLAGKLSRQGSPLQVRHVAEILAGDVDSPALGKPMEE